MKMTDRAGLRLPRCLTDDAMAALQATVLRWPGSQARLDYLSPATFRRQYHANQLCA
jgi:hypothetical protein